MSFHQNGLTLTLFAKDYTYKQVDAITNIFFNLSSILIFIGCIGGLVVLLNKKLRINWRMIGGAAFIILGGIVYYIVKTSANLNSISPEIFQSFNPLFIVSLTFVVMGIFSILNKKGLEPSTPKKIGIGMIIASFGFLLVLICSLDLVSPMHLKEVINGKEVFQVLPDASRVTPYWLIGSYLILTIAELFLSPMGLSFVSKVAPSRFQGLMQGGWLLATAVGNKLLIVGSFFWSRVELWQLWSIFMVCCLLSAAFIFSVMKRLERTTKG
jgi:POT family proton-dependent oligopeptide transporter